MKNFTLGMLAIFFGLMLGFVAGVPTATIASDVKLRPVSLFESQMMNPVFKIDNTCSAVVVKSRASEGKRFETLLLTAAHCVKGPTRGFLDDSIWDGHQLIVKREWEYEVLRKDHANDLALLRLYDQTTVFPVAMVAAEATMQPGEMMFAAGFPKALIKTVTTGMFVNTLDMGRYIRKGKTDMVYVTTIPIVGGNSGGGLFVKKGGQYYLTGITSRVMVGFEHNSLFSTLPAVHKILAFKDIL